LEAIGDRRRIPPPIAQGVRRSLREPAAAPRAATAAEEPSKRFKAGPSVYVVEDILRSKGEGSSKRYLIKWRDYDRAENTWEPASSLHPTLVADFEKAQEEPNRGAPLHVDAFGTWYRVDALLAARRKPDAAGSCRSEPGRQFLVRWEDYGPDDDTWEDEENILDASLITAFDRTSKKKRKTTVC